MNKTLSARWQQLAATFTDDSELRTTTFRQLSEAYEASDRHYHTFTHIRALLDVVHPTHVTLHDPAVVQLAVWFHDAVYNSLRDDNEARSAVLAQEFLQKTTCPADRIARVMYLIERTKDHTQPQPAADTDLLYFLDADLQILGASEADYWQYARHVRQEYRLVPDFMYRRGRRKVLTKLLETPVLYRTPEFQARLDSNARRNLRAELQAWENGGL